MLDCVGFSQIRSQISKHSDNLFPLYGNFKRNLKKTKKKMKKLSQYLEVHILEILG